MTGSGGERAGQPALPLEPLAASAPAWPAARTHLHDHQTGFHKNMPVVVGLAITLAMTLLATGVYSVADRFNVAFTGFLGKGEQTARSTVLSYLTAVAAGDVDRAIAYLPGEPTGPLLTAEALARSAALAPITDITTEPGVQAKEGGERVQVTYRMGSQQVTTSFHTRVSRGVWILDEPPARVNVASLHPAAVPILVNGISISSEVAEVLVLPGVYEFSSGDASYTFGTSNRLVIRGPNEAASLGGVQLQLSDAGRKSALTAVKAALDSCLQRQELQPPGCPQNVAENPGEPAIKESIKWSFGNDPIASTTLSVVGRTGVVEARVAGVWMLNVNVVSGGKPVAVSLGSRSTTTWLVDMTATPQVAVYKG